VNFDTAGSALWIRHRPGGDLIWTICARSTGSTPSGSLDKCFSYLNFYVGLLAALLAATLTGLLQAQPGDARALLLLTGPAAALVLARLGYQTFYVFYRRYVESWVTEINLQAMLGTEYAAERDYWPTYCSKPIGRMDRPGRANRG
jgi:hypothetical protein